MIRLFGPTNDPTIVISRGDEVLDTLGDGSVSQFLVVYLVNDSRGDYLPDCLLHSERPLQMSSHAPRGLKRPRLVRFGDETSYSLPRQHYNVS